MTIPPTITTTPAASIPTATHSTLSLKLIDSGSSVRRYAAGWRNRDAARSTEGVLPHEREDDQPDDHRQDDAHDRKARLPVVPSSSPWIFHRAIPLSAALTVADVQSIRSALQTYSSRVDGSDENFVTNSMLDNFSGWTVQESLNLSRRDQDLLRKAPNAGHAGNERDRPASVRFRASVLARHGGARERQQASVTAAIGRWPLPRGSSCRQRLGRRS